MSLQSPEEISVFGQGPMSGACILLSWLHEPCSTSLEKGRQLDSPLFFQPVGFGAADEQIEQGLTIFQQINQN